MDCCGPPLPCLFSQFCHYVLILLCPSSSFYSSPLGGELHRGDGLQAGPSQRVWRLYAPAAQWSVCLEAGPCGTAFFLHRLLEHHIGGLVCRGRILFFEGFACSLPASQRAEIQGSERLRVRDGPSCWFTNGAFSSQPRGAWTKEIAKPYFV